MGMALQKEMSYTGPFSASLPSMLTLEMDDAQQSFSARFPHLRGNGKGEVRPHFLVAALH